MYSSSSSTITTTTATTVPVWNQYLKKDIKKLENIQHRAKRLAKNLRKKGYEYRMKKLRLTTLEIRRKMGDLIQFYKVLSDHIKWKRT